MRSLANLARRSSRRALLLGIPLAFAACGKSTSPPPPTAAEIEAARGALAPLKESLQAALKGAMPQGPAAAIEVCRLQAPGIEAAINEATANGARVGRTSHRLRNPANAPAAWMERSLAQFVSGSTQAEGMAVRLPDGSAGWLEPIRMKEMCLKCHGSELPDDVTALLTEHYPDDRATGFADGDFRGLFWATVPAGG